MALFLDRVRLRNYKNIEACDVALQRLTFLVGPNGSGKSNFLDALRLVSDALRTPLEHALRERGGIKDVRRRSTGHPHNFGIRLDMHLPSGGRAMYGFEIGAEGDGGFRVAHEECRVGGPEPMFREHYFVIEHRRNVESIDASFEHPPARYSDRLYLTNVSGLAPFRELYDALANMGFYNLNPAQIREVQPPDPGGVLLRDGRNTASVLGRLASGSPGQAKLVKRFLNAIVPDIQDVERVPIANKETLEFRQRVKGSKHPWRFYANCMSDGTLRALGVLVALFQGSEKRGARVHLIGIEEPESALHPAALGVLLDALRAASERTQVLVTSHSPQLLDVDDFDERQLLAIQAQDGRARIGPVDQQVREILRDHLATPGELLSQGQLQPDLQSLEESVAQVDLFETSEEPPA